MCLFFSSFIVYMYKLTFPRVLLKLFYSVIGLELCLVDFGVMFCKRLVYTQCKNLTK